MTLAAGTHLGPYEIVAPLGAGGMGEVYKARDTRLDRTVAIKVLPAHVADDLQVRERFEREARAVAALNHPHICTLHDIGHQDRTDFLVMEYLDGETLATRLEKGLLPLDQALQYAIQIADALDKAHRKGVTHRDLKPGNIMLTKGGAKLLDFGLAKLKQEVAPANVQLSALPTAKDALTAQGTILGTLQYMAPEQLEGHEVDARTDVFAFGAVVYEMATGKKAFEGQSQASVIAAILEHDPPPMASLQPMTPPALDHVVKTCLAKDPDGRWQAASDLTRELKWIAEGGSEARVPAATVARRKSRERLAWTVATLVTCLAGVALAVAYLTRAPAEVRSVTLSVVPPEKMALAGAVAISRDGRRLAFVATTPEGRRLLWIRPLDSLAAQPLTGTDGAYDPFWSPDGRALGFFAQGKLKKIDLSGGSPQTLADAPDGRGGTWSRDGAIVFGPDALEPLYRVSATGGPATAVTKLDRLRQEMSHRFPHFLPDGRHFLYLVRSARPESRGLYVGSLDSKETRRLLDVYSSAAYAPPGYLLFVRGGTTLTAQPFDPDRLDLTGAPVPVAEQVGYVGAAVGYIGSAGQAAFSVSENGILTYRPGGLADAQLRWFDRRGMPLGSVGLPGFYLHISLSPDQQRIAAARNDPQTGTADIWLFDVSRGTSSRLTFDPSHDQHPCWSPDGSRIVFSANRVGPDDLYQKLSSGAGSDELLFKSGEQKSPTDWSLDGRFIVYQSLGAKTKHDLWVLPLFGDRQPMPFLQTASDERDGRLSPDGRWMAYSSDESGRYEVYVQSFPASGGKWQVSTDGGTDPLWRRDGKELFYVAADGRLMAVQVDGGSTLEAGAPSVLFQARIVGGAADVPRYAVTADGQRFLINTVTGEASSAPITVVLNWTAGLKR